MGPRLLILASGTAHGGGSGFANLVHATRQGKLEADICGVVSSHAAGGVYNRAVELGMEDRFFHFPGPWTAQMYQTFVERTGAEFVALSGWLKPVAGLDPRTTFNIHPGPLPEFGGKGMYGHHVHEAVLAAYNRGEIDRSAVTMHFVTAAYDDGPVFFRQPVLIRPDDTPETLGERVNLTEHHWQPQITDLVLCGDIAWDGVNPESLTGELLL